MTGPDTESRKAPEPFSRRMGAGYAFSRGDLNLARMPRADESRVESLIEAGIPGSEMVETIALPGIPDCTLTFGTFNRWARRFLADGPLHHPNGRSAVSTVQTRKPQRRKPAALAQTHELASSTSPIREGRARVAGYTPAGRSLSVHLPAAGHRPHEMPIRFSKRNSTQIPETLLVITKNPHWPHLSDYYRPGARVQLDPVIVRPHTSMPENVIAASAGMGRSRAYSLSCDSWTLCSLQRGFGLMGSQRIRSCIPPHSLPCNRIITCMR